MTAGSDAEDQVVRPALEAALDVAEAGLNETPPREPPRALRAVLGFRKRPAAALSTVRRVLDADEEFRGLVLEQTDATSLSTGAEAFLRREAGWQELVEAGARAIEEAAADDRARAAERSAVQQVARLQARLDELEAAREADRVELARLVDVEARLDSARDRVGALERTNERLVDERRRAVRELTEERRRLAERTAEARELQESLDRRRAEPPAAEGGETDQRLARAEDSARSASAEVARLAAELAAVAERLDPGAAPVVGGTDADDGADPAPTAAMRRRPVRVGRGLREGTPAATRALLETPGLVLWVDGYNVTMSLWGDLDLAAQRRALITALSTPATSWGTEIRVVFDGDTGGAPAVTAPLRVRVRFTEAGVEADDDIIDGVAATDQSIPVAVMSADRRVRDAVAAHGANLLRPEDLRRLLGGGDRPGVSPSPGVAS
ncbi:MAG: NYN domain-containing protein [Microthrixaceae bacterium]|nr:NYN domain-containing protein [Microthrixaceae bacterium]